MVKVVFLVRGCLGLDFGVTTFPFGVTSSLFGYQNIIPLLVCVGFCSGLDMAIAII